MLRPPPALAALAAVVLAGCIAAPAAEQPAALPPAPAEVAAPLEPIAFTNLTATLLALPLVGGEARLEFEVPEGSAWVAAVLKWPTRGPLITLAMIDPAGQPQGEARPVDAAGPPPARRLDWWASQPAAGTWTAVVRGDAALQEPLALQVHTLPRTVAPMHVAEALRVARGFAEVNTEMRAGDTFTWSWASAAPLAFDIHTHRDGETIYLLEETGTGGNGTFTAEQDGGYSLLWQLPEASPIPAPGAGVDLAYRMDGAFALHSAVG